jgi:hypothetical protein
VIAVVVALAFLLLMLAFGSIVVPLTAAAMNLLSIAAAYGVLTAGFELGWGDELIGLDRTIPIGIDRSSQVVVPGGARADDAQLGDRGRRVLPPSRGRGRGGVAPRQ